jgi:hypothetical protein
MDRINYFQKLLKLDVGNHFLSEKQAESLWLRIRAVIFGKNDRE